jgi:hypothetical protein
MIPGIYAIVKVIRASRGTAAGDEAAVDRAR